MSQQNNKVINVPPRRRAVRWKGLHGWLEYRPALKVWQYTLKLIYPVTINGQHTSEAHAELELKKHIETAVNGKNKQVRTVD